MGAGRFCFGVLHRQRFARSGIGNSPEFNLNADQAQRYIQRTADVIKELKYVAGNRPIDGGEGGDTPAQRGNISIPDFEPLYPDSDCALMSSTWRNSLQSLAWFMRYWRDNFSTAYDLNRIF